MEVTCFFETSVDFKGLHGVKSQKIELLMLKQCVIAVET
jgi:hypothetical protein